MSDCTLCELDEWATIVRELDEWTVIEHPAPYAGTRAHYVIVPRTHVVDICELPTLVLRELWEAMSGLRDETMTTYFGMGIRNGYDHVVCHFVIGDNSPGAPVVRFTLDAKGSL